MFFYDFISLSNREILSDQHEVARRKLLDGIAYEAESFAFLYQNQFIFRIPFLFSTFSKVASI